MSIQTTRVLVTGGTGFIAQHCMLALLAQGYRVRTTVRVSGREAEIRANLQNGGIDAGDRLEIVLADLTHDEGWAQAADGCRYVLHGASPTPSGPQVSEADWVNPAVDGNLRVLRAARSSGVKRVVLTSAFGAVGVGHAADYRRPFDETDWSELNSDVALYQKSKTLSEHAAWEFIAREGNGLELAAINPVAVLGPALGADYSHSVRLIKNLLEGQPGCLRINSGFVDVRDVADLHLRAMTDPAASGERFLAIAGESMWMEEVAKVLRDSLGEQARRVSTQQIPDEVVLKNPALVNGLVSLLGVNMNATSAKAIRLLGWSPRPREEAIIACAESLFRLGLVT
ncbi:Nucleoside-diphosphate-sugar epimerase [Kosakonia arachidis]|uniref:Nucleoside-diphosphate-sugar epimerase n=1 Tax=Kosakonia arachidis TaxID=551989 RepID=A0A1I6YAW6_9ENTR|nr:aldehyde reductase [Kosakonia arachidis]SFT47497.1 Nucleoside-diphosphate-sugar epimerase [Kosakonia arachidis]